MARNTDADDIMSLISGDDDMGGSKGPSTQQSLRDRMLNESRANQQDFSQVEEELSEEIISEEEDEEYGNTDKKKKTGIIIGAVIAVLLIVGILIVVFAGKGDSNAEEASTEVVMDLTPVAPIIEEPVVEEPVNIFALQYDMEQINNLRAAGATEEQLQDWQTNGVNYDYVYFTMLDKYYGWQLTNTLPTYDLASDAYKEVVDQTWMSLPKRTDIVEWNEEMLAYEHEVTQNLDYEKVEPYGNQLFLKVYLDVQNKDSWFFLNITPNEWNQLDDVGNVVVHYKYQTHWLPFENQLDKEEDEENIFIISAQLDIIESLKNIADRKQESNSNSLVGE